MVRYNPYTDSFIDNSTKETTATTATINLDAFPMSIVQIVEVSDESIEKIADAVVRKLTDHKTKPMEVSYTKEISTTAKGYSKTVTKPQTENICDGCVCDDGKHLMYCMNCKGIAVRTEPPKIETEPQIFTWGKEVHEFCKMKCNKSKARSFGDDRFIVCGQLNDAICISLPACPLGKWIAGKEYHILPMDEPQTERSE